ncbi:MAG: arylsulfotransferase family protein [Solirubrobacterales bacterium]|nr:arylsulfotransferase family protein [Solirubrobacterales bacterium]
MAVVGSRSGAHDGRRAADSDGQGGSFLPNEPFAPGEVVTVKTKLDVRGAPRGEWQFRVADPAGPVPRAGFPPAARVPGDVLQFRSRADLAPASVEITKPAAAASGGDIFIAPQQAPAESGPMIVDQQGSLVWFQAVPPGQIASDFRVQRYQGKPVLTWWEGYLGPGVGVGEDVIDDASYVRLATVRAANGLSADLHEFQLTPRGTALITAYYPVYRNAASVHGPARQIVFDCAVQEIDVKTGLVLFQWDSLDHVPLADTYQPLPTGASAPFDYFHVNSVQEDANDGTLIVSARNTWAAYKIDAHDGRVIWTLGGKRSSFKMSSAAKFAFQHDARVRPATDEEVTIFDDGAGPPTVHGQSRGLTLSLDPQRGTATVEEALTHSPPLLASYEGNVQSLPNGDQFLGWGQQPYFSEFNRAGQMVFDGRFIGGNSSYRAYRFPWTGTPRTRPAISATASSGQTTVYVSWNGATNVASWRVLAGPSATALTAAIVAPKQGFETQIDMPSEPYVAVQALDSSGDLLATSPTVQPGRPGG